MPNQVRSVERKIRKNPEPPANVRAVERKFHGTETLEGAGVRLRRMFGNSEVPLLDPFLLLDNFGSTNPQDYLRRFSLASASRPRDRHVHDARANGARGFIGESRGHRLWGRYSG